MQANVEHSEKKMTDLKSNAVKNKSRNIWHNLRNKSFPTPEFVPGCEQQVYSGKRNKLHVMLGK